MSQPAGIENPGSQGQGQPNGDQSTAPPNFQNPIQQPQQQQGQAPYAEYLNKLPESARPLVEPIFREWDANTTQRFQQYSEQINRLKPYEQFAQYDPQAIQMSVKLAELMQNDPEQVFKILADQLEYDLDEEDFSQLGEQGQTNPEIEALRNGLSEVTQLIQQQQEQQAEQQETNEILSYLQAIEDQYGALDWEWVLTKAAATENLEGAVEEYYSKYYRPDQDQQQSQQNVQQGMVNVGGLQVPANHPLAAQTQQPPAPLGAGGGLPSETRDLGKLTSQERQALVAQTLAAANETATQA